MKKIIAYEIVDHGVEHEQYFQGCGVAATKYHDVYTGMGSTLKGALIDAVNQLSESYEISDTMHAEIFAEAEDIEQLHPGDVADDMYYYASIRVMAKACKHCEGNV